MIIPGEQAPADNTQQTQPPAENTGNAPADNTGGNASTDGSSGNDASNNTSGDGGWNIGDAPIQ